MRRLIPKAVTIHRWLTVPPESIPDQQTTKRDLSGQSAQDEAETLHAHGPGASFRYTWEAITDEAAMGSSIPPGHGKTS